MIDKMTAILGIFRLIVLALSTLVTYYSLRAYLDTGAYYLRNASVGFGIITLGLLIEGVLYEFGGLDLAVVHIIESIAIGLGFLVLLISLRR